MSKTEIPRRRRGRRGGARPKWRGVARRVRGDEDACASCTVSRRSSTSRGVDLLHRCLLAWCHTIVCVANEPVGGQLLWSVADGVRWSFPSPPRPFTVCCLQRCRSSSSCSGVRRLRPPLPQAGPPGAPARAWSGCRSGVDLQPSRGWPSRRVGGRSPPGLTDTSGCTSNDRRGRTHASGCTSPWSRSLPERSLLDEVEECIWSRATVALSSDPGQGTREDPKTL